MSLLRDFGAIQAQILLEIFSPGSQQPIKLKTSIPPFMRKHQSLVLSVVAVWSLLRAPFSGGQSVTTEPVGFMTDSLLGNSDTFISLPLIRPPAFVGGIQSAGGTTITVPGGPWTANQFVYAPGTQPNHYYALIGPATATNPKEGHTYAIAANGPNTLTVQAAPGDDLLNIR